jgi:hypothetical protein
MENSLGRPSHHSAKRVSRASNTIARLSEPITGQGLAEKTREVCRNTRNKFRDPVLSLPTATEESRDAELGDLKWACYTEVMKDRSRLFREGESSLSPGILTGDYFFNAVCLLSQKPELVRNLFDCWEINQEGVYGVWIQVDGTWTEQTIDEVIPMISTQAGCLTIGGILGAEEELWPMILEKAYARAWGGIDQVQFGSCLSTLRDLTGAAYTTFKDFTDCSMVLERIQVALSHNWLLLATANTVKGQELGLYKDELYSVVEVSRPNTFKMNDDSVLVHLRDHRRSPKNDELKGNSSTQTHFQKGSSATFKQGHITIPLKDFGTFIDSLSVLMVEPEWENHSVQLDQSQSNKSLVALEVFEEADLCVSIDQLDPRHFDHSDQYHYSYLRITVCRVTEKQVQFIDCKLSSQRSIFLSDKLVPGKYLVLVQTYWHETTTDRTLTLAVSSQKRVTVQGRETSSSFFDRLEYYLWTNFARNNQDTFESKHTELSDCNWYARVTQPRDQRIRLRRDHPDICQLG